ncbi:hypothetical protein [Amaricoccus solimangrovi]|uniref:Uncharacterized protein n=1 Tax=Amaricoccus solimangrovi TaxID=2589815 RepID=A0A501WTN4_9RHOB|nr:hypothetical protein [Amaricoccus solimangrovi]TPE52142.1 hypothetical protein FJM51_06870 [Amaricoccus solimangrovi]
MIELVFVACLKAEPRTCEQKILSYVWEGEAASGTSCFMRAQPELATWAREHPAFTIVSWKCEESSRREIDV